MKPQRSTQGAERDAENRIDAALKRALAPDEATVRRVLRKALAESPPPVTVPAPWRLAAVVAGLAAVVLALGLLFSPEPPEAVRVTVSDPTSSAEPAALRISNQGGMVTVTTLAGSKMVLLPELPQPGDAS